MEPHLFGQLLENGLVRRFAVPHKRSEGIVATQFAREAEIRVQQRYDAGVMVGNRVHHTHHSVLVHHTHFRLDAVKTPLVHRDIVVRIYHAVIDNRGKDEPEPSERIGGPQGILKQLLAEGTVMFPQGNNLALQVGCASLEVGIDVPQIYVACDIGRHIIHPRYHGVGRGEVDMVLERVALEQQEATDGGIEHEQEPCAVAYEEVE